MISRSAFRDAVGELRVGTNAEVAGIIGMIGRKQRSAPE